jgi:hypothetical protein
MPDLVWFESEKCPEGYTLEELKPEHVDLENEKVESPYRFDVQPKKSAPPWVKTIIDDWADSYNGINFGHYIIAKSDKLKAYEPLKYEPAAFMEYGDTSACADLALAFVNKYGPPEFEFSDSSRGYTPLAFPVEGIQDISHLMKDAIKIWSDAQASGNYEELVGFKFLEQFDELELCIFSGEIHLDLRPKRSGEIPQLVISPITLTAAMWVQFAQAVASETQLNRCNICPSWFAYGTGTGRRKSSQYCSDKCRKAAHRMRTKANT